MYVLYALFAILSKIISNSKTKLNFFDIIKVNIQQRRENVYENEENVFVFDRDWYSHEITVCKGDDLLRLISLPNVLITSHQAYFTQEALKEISLTTIDNIIEFIQKDRTNKDGSFKLKYELH